MGLSERPEARIKPGGGGASIQILGLGGRVGSVGAPSPSHTPLQLGASSSSPKMLPEIEMGWQEGRGSGRRRGKGD